MKSIIANIVRGKGLSYLLAAGLTFAAAQTALAKVNANAYWNGKGSDAKWSTKGNWLNNNDPWDCNNGKILFKTTAENNSIDSYTALLDRAVSIEKSLWIEDGSSLLQPYVFEALNSSCGLTLAGGGSGSEYKGNAYVGYDADGYLQIKSGAYSFNRLALGNGNATSRVGWLKIGDGSSTVSIAATGGQPEVSGASKLIADKATLDFTGQKFYMRQSGGAYITNSTMTANRIVLDGSSSMTASGSTITATGDHSNFTETSQFIADNATLVFTGKNFNMYGTSSANIKDATMTAAILNLAVNEGNNCNAVFNGGSLTLSSTSLIGYGKNAEGYLYATNLTFKIDGSSSHLSLGGQDTNKSCATGVVDKKGGDWTIGGDLWIGAQDSSWGTFTTDGGSVTVGGDTYIAKGSASTGTLTIKNGTFATKRISHTGTATLNMDGCTLKAGADNVNLIDSDITVNVGANGGTIDNDNKAITVAAPITGTGAMTFAGGGSVTLSASATYTGVTTVSNSTTLALGSDVSLVGDLSLLPGATLSSSSGFTLAGGRTVGVAASGTANFNSNLSLADNATLGFNFTENLSAPVLAIGSGKTVTANGTVKVKVSAAGGIRPKGGTYTLASGGGFTGVNVSVDQNDKPKWVDGISVNGDGNIVLTVKPMGLMFLVL